MKSIATLAVVAILLAIGASALSDGIKVATAYKTRIVSAAAQ